MDREDSFHAHLEQGCGYAEKYPHHMQHCSHRNILLNRKGLEETVDKWPAFIQAANDMTGMSRLGREGDRGIIGGVFQESGAWERVINPPRMPRSLTMNLMEEALKLYTTAGVTMVSSSVEFGSAMTAVYDILRRDNRLPIRWGFGYEMFRSPVMYPNNSLIVVELGAQHGTAKVNPWFWPMGITDGGVGDSRQVACFGEDLPGPQMLKERELCWDPDAFRIQEVLIPALKAGWRPFSLHSFGSEAFRKHMAWIEQARVEGRMSKDDIRAMRIGFAHGGAVGKIPDVMEIMKDYNFYVPLQPNDVAASLKQVRRYGPEGLQFLAPTKTLIESGVQVVGETEYSRPRPDIYFNAFDMFVNRRIRHESEPLEAGEIVMPEEAVSRATALRLFTSKAAEWLYVEDLAGSLEPGRFADFAVLDRDYFSVPAMEIPNNKVIMTVVGDKIIYTDPEYEPGITNNSM
jgi:predicted amidohydrolase YtcJ